MGRLPPTGEPRASLPPLRPALTTADRRARDTRRRSLPRGCANRLAASFVSAIVLLTLASGCRQDQAQKSTAEDQPGTPAARILLVGVDGLEWNVMLPMLARDELPNLARLMEHGQYGLLETFIPTASPAIWTSVATGKTRDKHGIEGFGFRVGDGDLELYNNSLRKTKALWNICSDYGKRVCVVGWWMTFPVEPVNGVMVAQTNTMARLNADPAERVWKGTLARGVARQVYPPDRQDEMMAVLENVDRDLDALTHDIFGPFPHPPSPLATRLWNNCLAGFRADATYRQIALRLAREEPSFDLMLVYFGGTDEVGHRFWRYMQPRLYRDRPPPEQVDNFGRIIADYYSHTDSVIGELISAAGPDVTVIVASDHGMVPINVNASFDPDAPLDRLNSGHHYEAPPGVLIAAGPLIRPSPKPLPLRRLQRSDLVTLGSVFDVCPTILSLMNIPVGRDMDGRALTDLIDKRLLARGLPDKIESHDTLEFVMNRPKPPSHDPAQDERLEQLRTLGYIQADDEPR